MTNFHDKIMKHAKGFRGRRKNCYTIAIRAVYHGWKYMFPVRHLKRRTNSSRTIMNINAGARQFGSNYSKTINWLKKESIVLNRTMLAELAATEPSSFHALAEVAKISERLTVESPSGGFDGLFKQEEPLK